jgi:hypothetical protein
VEATAPEGREVRVVAGPGVLGKDHTAELLTVTTARIGPGRDRTAQKGSNTAGARTAGRQVRCTSYPAGLALLLLGNLGLTAPSLILILNACRPHLQPTTTICRLPRWPPCRRRPTYYRTRLTMEGRLSGCRWMNG